MITNCFIEVKVANSRQLIRTDNIIRITPGNNDDTCLLYLSELGDNDNIVEVEHSYAIMIQRLSRISFVRNDITK